MTGAEGWHPEVVDAKALDALRQLFDSPLLTDFYLARGTGLALSLGHRRSVDLDVFSGSPIHVDELLGMVREGFDAAIVESQSHDTLHVRANGTQISFLEYRYPLLRPLKHFGNVRIADPADIGCMKLSAIASRGTRRDFVDLYAVAQDRGLPRLLGLFDEKFSGVRYSRLHLLKSLVYFEEAEKEPEPHTLVDLEWEPVKQFFLTEVPPCLQTPGS